MKRRQKIVVLRGHQATPWELIPWSRLRDRFDVEILVTRRNPWKLEATGLQCRRVTTWGSFLPLNRFGDAVVTLMNDRYLGLPRLLADADVVHAEELSFWFAAQAAGLRTKPGCSWKLVQTVWESLPLLNTYRHYHGRKFRRQVLASTDLFLPVTERAAAALKLEGVDEERVVVCQTGIDERRFQTSRSKVHSEEHPLILSPGRLVWEKGHQDVLRAVSALHRGFVGRIPCRPRLRILGAGPEKRRLRALTHELGLDPFVEILECRYEAVPQHFQEASCMVLASLPAALKPYHLFDRPRIFWEEQFGMVLIEALAVGCPILASRCGAIPETLTGTGAELFNPGDWENLARLLADGPLRRARQSIAFPEERAAFFSAQSAGDRLAAAYERVLQA